MNRNQTSVHLFALIALVSLLLSACQPSPTPTPTTIPSTPTSTAIPIPSPTEEPTPTQAPSPADAIYLSLVWHQHQPLYYKDTDGVYTRPWARAHATKDYYDMAAILQSYPDVHVTFNLTPVLIRQLDDLAAGAKDYYWVLSEIPAG